jgi:hypothetical protein
MKLLKSRMSSLFLSSAHNNYSTKGKEQKILKDSNLPSNKLTSFCFRQLCGDGQTSAAETKKKS